MRAEFVCAPPGSVQTASHDALPRRKFLDPELNEVRLVFPTSRNSYAHSAARGRQAEAPGSIGAARGVCSHPGRAARHESPEGELRRLAGYDQTLARRGSFLRPDRWPLDVLTESTASATLGSTAPLRFVHASDSKYSSRYEENRTQ